LTQTDDAGAEDVAGSIRGGDGAMWLLRACPRCGGDLVQERAVSLENSPDYVCFQCGRSWPSAVVQSAGSQSRSEAFLPHRQRAAAQPAHLYAAWSRLCGLRLSCLFWSLSSRWPIKWS